MLLWPPDGSQVTVTVSGIANDAASGVVRINWLVDDEYNQVEPSGSITVVNGVNEACDKIGSFVVTEAFRPGRFARPGARARARPSLL